jgi:hypothetical protein
MSLEPAAGLGGDDAEGYLRVVVDRHDGLKGDRIEIGGGPGTPTGVVHKGLGLEEDDPDSRDLGIGNKAVELSAPRESTRIPEVVAEESAGVVPCAVVLLSGVSQEHKHTVHIPERNSFALPRQERLWYDAAVGKYGLSLILFFLAATLPGEEVLVVGANTWSGLTYRGAFSSGSYEEAGSRSFRFDLLADELRSLDPGIAVLFEANPLPRYAEEIGARLEMDSLFYVRRGGFRIGPIGFPTNLREGTVVLADGPFDLRYTGLRRLSGGFVTNVTSAQSGEVSHVVATAVTVADRRVHLFAVNLFPSPLSGAGPLARLLERYLSGQLSGEEYRRRVDLAVTGAERRLREARAALTFINETAGAEPAILVGTLSAPPDSPEVRLFVDAGFVDASGRSGGVTWDPANNANIDIERNTQGPGEAARIDYIMVRGEGIRVRGSEIILDEPTYGEYPSDHYGIAARIEVSPTPE